MPENKVSLDLEVYEELLNAKSKLNFVRKIIFNKENRLSYNKEDISFSIDAPCVKLIFPEEYGTQLKELLRGEE